MRHLLSPLDFSTEELDELMDLAADIEQRPDAYAPVSYTHLDVYKRQQYFQQTVIADKEFFFRRGKAGDPGSGLLIKQLPFRPKEKGLKLKAAQFLYKPFIFFVGHASRQIQIWAV